MATQSNALSSGSGLNALITQYNKEEEISSLLKVYGIGMDEFKGEDKLLASSVASVVEDPVLHRAMLTMKHAIQE